METLIGQFSRFAVQKDLETNDWAMAATELGVNDTLRNIDRFHASWDHSDNDQQANTTQFLTEVAEEDEEQAVGVMKRIYTLADTDTDTLEKYPALEILENKGPGTGVLHSTFRSEQFLDIDNVPGTFYPDLVEDINRCYSIGVNDATLVLTRKLLENLLIDILREQYGKQEIDLYYLPSNHRFKNFSTLINNFEDNLDDFQHLSGGLDSDFIDELNAFRKDANSGAHSIETNITASEMQDYREQAQHASQVLLRLWRNI
ncbi:hypothetical protein [Haloarcula laminariae]|uniref:hypothetical protein n=1 Tax=Haloarcula laminariae TaxID=2961577 RepID=UPI0021C5E5A2|nr:hypothetical protein [Halomicroarcula laminariae]